MEDRRWLSVAALAAAAILLVVVIGIASMLDRGVDIGNRFPTSPEETVHETEAIEPEEATEATEPRDATEPEETETTAPTESEETKPAATPNNKPGGTANNGNGGNSGNNQQGTSGGDTNKPQTPAPTDPTEVPSAGGNVPEATEPSVVVPEPTEPPATGSDEFIEGELGVEDSIFG